MTELASAARGHSRGRRSLGAPEASLKAQQLRDHSLERKQLSEKTKSNLQMVPCKFFRQGMCTAGDQCSFSHESPVQGQGKTICAWYQKGSCRFGHKCALAHVMPGEPLSNDRKNKRAQQLAQREAAQRENDLLDTEGVELPADTAHQSMERKQPVPAKEVSIGIPRPPNNLSALSTSPHSSTVPLASAPGMPSLSPVNARPVVLESNGRQASQHSLHSGSPVFSTSPFSPPGTSSVFFSSSLGSDEGTRDGAFGGAAARRAVSPLRNNGMRHAHYAGFSDDDDQDDDGQVDEGLGNSRHEEDCLPSSLSDLMTPDEIYRRQRKLHPVAGVLPEGLSKSVPHAAPLPSPVGSYKAVAEYQATPSHVPVLLSPGSNAPHEAGSSLPPGLAAGLSRLHFQAPRHTGESPLSSRGASPIAMAGGITSLRTNGAIIGSPLARAAWPQEAHSLRTEEARSPAASKEPVTSFEPEAMFDLEV